LDLSRKRLDFCLPDQAGKTVEAGAALPDADGLRGLAARLARFAEPVQAAMESMNGARFVHDQLEQAGWEVEIADAVKVKRLAPLARKTDRSDARVLAELARRELMPCASASPLTGILRPGSLLAGRLRQLKLDRQLDRDLRSLARTTGDANRAAERLDAIREADKP
jgi:hypothetical protein